MEGRKRILVNLKKKDVTIHDLVKVGFIFGKNRKPDIKLCVV
jgi:hypothetical protein